MPNDYLSNQHLAYQHELQTQRLLARRQLLEQKKRAAMETMIKSEEGEITPLSQGTGQLLKQAWLYLIPSYGLTLIWINIHVFLNKVLGDKIFCKLGEEWIPKEIQKMGGAIAKLRSKRLGLLEAILLGILDALVLTVILSLVVLFMAMVDYAYHPWKIFFS